jgi:3-deoxy-D-manno-octulosonic acid kinase
MNGQILKSQSGVIVYDAELFSLAKAQPGPAWFDPDWWREKSLVVSERAGRGTTLIVDTPVGRAALRQYLRGGWVAKLVRSRYFFTGYRRSRPFREFRILEKLAVLNLPAPRPVAAICRRHGFTSTGALITLEIPNARPLEEVLPGLDANAWRTVGACIRKFHQHGVVHLDLTVRNILIQEGGGIFVIDFDRARIHLGATRAFSNNLQRLRRSLLKAWPETERDMEALAWTHLLQGYES